jgi:hypothetical protein
MTKRFCTFAAAVFALLTMTAPAHAAFVSDLDADLNLNFGSSTQLVGSIDLTWLPVGFGGAACCRVSDYILLDSSLSLNGVPLTPTGIGQNAFSYDGTTVEIFAPVSPFGFPVFGINTDYLPPNPTFSNFLLAGTPATSGTVTVLSETLATPLPAALPLFGSAVLALAGLAWRRGKVSA